MSERTESHHRNWRDSLLGWLYNVGVAFLLWPTLAYFAWRALVRGKSRAGLLQRLGVLPASVRALSQGPDPVVWAQAVSVGEVRAIAPLLGRLRLLDPLAHIVLSTTTPTGQNLARKTLAEETDLVFYFPFDYPAIVRRALSLIRPRLLVMVETELWPNLLTIARSQGVATAIVNARISDRALRRYLFFRRLFAWTLASVDLICAQSEADAARFLALGARREAVVVMGNTKFDEHLPQVSESEVSKWRLDLGLPRDAPVIVAGSTHPGEDRLVLESFAELRRDHPALQCVIAPRHPERGAEIERLVHEQGYSAYRRSRALAQTTGPEPPDPVAGPEVRIVILDSIGELARVFGVATVVFMGGSLVRKGGHNILQPIALGKPVVFGPHMFNFRDITEIALREGAGRMVADHAELTQALRELLDSEQERSAQRERGPALIARYSGASERMALALEGLLRPSTEREQAGDGMTADTAKASGPQ